MRDAGDGCRSERIECPTLFDGDDPPGPDVVIPAADTPVSPEETVSKRKGHGRKKNPANLPRKREEINLSDAEKICPCCAGLRIRIGETVRERLDSTPSSIPGPTSPTCSINSPPNRPT